MNTSIRQKRLDRGLTLIEAARLLSTDPGNLSRIESGKQEPRPVLARRISAEYDMSLDDIFAVPGEAA